MTKRFILGTAALFVVCGAIVSAYLRWNQRPAPTPPPASAQPALEKVDLGEWSGGKKVWSLQADRVIYDKERQNAVLNEIKTQFWEGKTLVSEAESPYAHLDIDHRRIEMKGGIAVDSKIEDSSVRAQQVSWNGGQQRLHASGSVSFRRGQSVVRCKDLYADRALRRVTMQGPIEARFNLEIP